MRLGLDAIMQSDIVSHLPSNLVMKPTSIKGFFCIMGGAGFLILQVILYAFLQKSIIISIATAPIFSVAILPLIAFMLPSSRIQC
jgi:hypothetical protein